MIRRSRRCAYRSTLQQASSDTTSFPLVIARTDLMLYMLTRPVLKGRIGKWILGLSEFPFRYVPMKAVKGQAFADFLADHAMNVFEPVELDEEVLAFAEVVPWTLYFDGSSTLWAAGAGVVLIFQARPHKQLKD